MRSQLFIPHSPSSPVQGTLSPFRKTANYSSQKEDLSALKERVMNRKKTYGKEIGGICKSSIFMDKGNHEKGTKSPIKILGDRGERSETIWVKNSHFIEGMQGQQECKVKENKAKRIEKEETLVSPKNSTKIEGQNLSSLKLEDFEIGDLLGKGASAKVRLAMHKDTRFLVSIKTIPRHKIEEKLEKFLQALKIQFFLDHPNIVKMYGVIVEVKEVHIIMEFCADGDLSTNRKLYSTENPSTKQTLYSLTQSLDYLHSNRIQHRDLKLENILLCYSVPKITDFELSVYTKCRFIQRKTMCGSPAYFSPEMIEKHRYNKKADIWCLGIIFYELLCGCFPFEMEKMEDIENIVCKEIKDMPNTISHKARELISSMLNKESEERVEIDEIMCSQFFKGVIEETGHSVFRG